MPRGLDVDEGAHEHASALKEAKPVPGRVTSEFDLSRAVALITYRDTLTALLCRVHNMASGHDFYITDDARDEGDNFISAPSWLKTDIADALIRRIDETKERITKEFGIPQ